MIVDVHYSSKKHTWETPQDFFNSLNEVFNFNLDSCAETDTAKCLNFYTKEDDDFSFMLAGLKVVSSTKERGD